MSDKKFYDGESLMKVTREDVYIVRRKNRVSGFEEGKKYSVIITVTQSGKTLVADTITEQPVNFVRLALDEMGPGFYGISAMEVGDDNAEIH